MPGSFCDLGNVNVSTLWKCKKIYLKGFLMFKVLPLSLCCTVIYPTVPSSTRADTVVANAMTKKGTEQDTKHFQNVMLVGMASKISKNYTYKCVDRSRHNGIKGAMTKCVR